MKKRRKPKSSSSARKSEIRHAFWDSLIVVGLLLGIFWLVDGVVGGFSIDAHELVAAIITAAILALLVIVLAYVNAFLLKRKNRFLANRFERLADAALGLLWWVFPSS